ncbi:hypothetical protein vB_PsyM_KIL4_0005 [Pseudomonas phage vB_PsyM_KIL4]|uniref:Uncharacterized protein n=1 Tax=Pseudomonas phage vB_PsyM_KIL4 TaxID=1777069 RepID=A0A142IET3_9CAUD|nr:hypothetical protein FDI83_gp005 [Pseudomonas phage vB_PsyM_KIL4]AMR57738.1 hypothetical protein vB_PsyM_KIL4_0005 [Pseudomonas phage vB_PsyM_KIL4]
MIGIRKIVPYSPPWKAESTHSIEFITEEFVDRMGNKATVCTAHYKDKKNKDRECVAWVKWEETNEQRVKTIWNMGTSTP